MRHDARKFSAGRHHPHDVGAAAKALYDAVIVGAGYEVRGGNDVMGTHIMGSEPSNSVGRGLRRQLSTAAA